MAIPADKLLGTWYELIRYRTDNDLPCIYNSHFTFFRFLPDTVYVKHHAHLNGFKISKVAIAYFRDEFVGITLAQEERERFVQQYSKILGYNPELIVAEPLPEMLIEKIWECHVKGPKYMVVSDRERKILHVLSQWPDPSEKDYAEIMTYLSDHFDLKRVIQIPHYSSHHYCTKTEFKHHHD